MSFTNPEIDVVQLYAPRYSLGAVVTPTFLETITKKVAPNFFLPSPTEGPHDYDKMVIMLNKIMKKYGSDIEVRNEAKWYVRYNKIRVGTRLDQGDGKKYPFPNRLSYCTLDGLDSYEIALDLAKRFDNYLTEQKSLRTKKNKKRNEEPNSGSRK